MSYLIIGEDIVAKDRTISEIQQQLLPAADARKFDYDVLDGSRIEPTELKKTLLALPAVASQRLIVIREAHKLKSQQKDILAGFMAGQSNHCVLVLEMGTSQGQDAFIRKIKPFVKVSETSSTEKTSVFDMTRAIEARHPAEALKLLRDMLDEGVHPLQIMGGMVWFWGKTKQRLKGPAYLDGLKALQEADLNIKRSRLPADHAMEVLVAKLDGLLRQET